jgi:hypothetical protein
MTTEFLASALFIKEEEDNMANSIKYKRQGGMLPMKRDFLKKTRRGISVVIDHQDVERAAYELYEQRGCKGGHDWEDWFAAEETVRKKIEERRKIQ